MTIKNLSIVCSIIFVFLLLLKRLVPKNYSQVRHLPSNTNRTENTGRQQKERTEAQDISDAKSQVVNYDNDEEHDNENAQHANRHPRTRKTPIEIYTFYLLIFTALYALVSMIQLYIDDEPQIGVISSGTGLDFAAGKPIRANVTIFNAGKTLAFHAKVQRILGILPPNEKIPQNRFSGSTWDAYSGGAEILPSQTYPATFLSDFVWSKDTMGQVESGAVITLLVRVTYEDSFFLAHTTTVCEYAIPSEGRLAMCLGDTRPDRPDR